MKKTTFTFRYMFLIILYLLISTSFLYAQDEEWKKEWGNYTGSSINFTFNGQDFTGISSNGKVYWEGDMIVSEHQSNSKTNGAIAVTTQQWPDGVVYYTVDPAITFQRSRITDAIAEWQNKTCIRFVARTNQANYVQFTYLSSGAPSSNVGMINGMQVVNVPDAASTGNIIHEIGHTLGLTHEQNRSDRDNFIVVHLENVPCSTYRDQYDKNTNDYHDNVFDFGSIMLYGSSSPCGDQYGNAMTRLDGSTWNAQRTALSGGDAAFIMSKYCSINSNSAPIGSTIWLKGNNQLYVCSENDNTAMNCNRPSVNGWEQFVIVDAGSGKVALRGSNGKYVSSENGYKAITCNRTSIGPWEQITWEDKGNNNVALKDNNARYISSENGSISMTCTRINAGSWEIFSWGIAGSSTPPSSGNCNFYNSNSDFNATVNGNSITFHPLRWEVGNNTCILYYSTNPTSTIPGVRVSPNVPYSMNNNSGQKVYFYYTYSLPEGGERNTAGDIQSFSAGTCGSLDKMDIPSLTLYPNPVSGEQVLVHLPANTTENNYIITVFDHTGNKMITETCNSTETTFMISCQGLSKGLYFINVSDQSITTTGKLIIK